MTGQQIRVRGIVQGVGFRPFVYNLATSLELTGWVLNSSRGVEIEIHGPDEAVQQFITTLRSSPPPLARIDTIDITPAGANGFTEFSIRHSEPQPGEFLPVSPDVAVCADCQRELFDPANRRYRYPFINCTNCGPRFTIVQDIPYDRPNTTMAGFPLCPDCQHEYDQPSDRRFHAQPVACPVCGPQVWLESGDQPAARGEEAIQAARDLLRQGRILAIKGLGGYHLACDAANPAAVQTLRERKHRNQKPFALMAFALEQVERHCQVSTAEAALLTGREKPIVLLQQQVESNMAAEVAPGQSSLGVMLAYTPLHLLLLEPEPGFPELLVMTSANLSEEPIAYQDDDARQRLAGLADAFLFHDRPIHMRVDDAVIRPTAAGPIFLRRARGYAPDPLTLPWQLPPILATGAELKNTFCLTRQEYAFVSHHIGDLENYETLRSFEQGIEHYQRLFRIQPEHLACDLHPNYLATRYAQERATREGLPVVPVQHHHAHLAACLADNSWTSTDPVIGLALDGTGLGDDGAIWGGEVLVGSASSYQRAYHLAYTPLPGGDQAVRKPARMALAHLWQAGLDWEADLAPTQALCMEERTVVRAQLERSLNAPLTSSMGRLFDAVAALLGVRGTVAYEGQAAMELEALADPQETDLYPFAIEAGLIDPAPVLAGLLADWRAGIPLPILSARFHNSVVQALAEICRRLRCEQGLTTVALSGGVWQNRFLLERTLQRLPADGFTVLTHHRLPPNDGGLALGQALVAASQIR